MARYRNAGYAANFPKLLEEYQMMGKIGEGSQAQVFFCRNRSSKKKVACKTFLKNSEAEARLEEQILRKLSGCPGVVHLEDVINEDDGSSCHLLMELCDLSLDQLIRTKGKLPEKEAALLIKNLAETVQQMHDRGIIHRDLKPENILVPSCSKPYDVRVSDFGLSACFSDSAPRFTQKVGTPIYFAPELVRGSYSTEIDIWDLGLILYESLTGLPVFPRLNMWGIYKELLDGVDLAAAYLDWPDDVVCEEAKDLVLAMLKPKAEDRITVQQILSHPWIIKHNSSDFEKKKSYKIKIRLPATEPQKKKDKAEDENLERSTFVLPPKKRIKLQEMSNDILQAAQPFVVAC